MMSGKEKARNKSFLCVSEEKASSIMRSMKIAPQIKRSHKIKITTTVVCEESGKREKEKSRE